MAMGSLAPSDAMPSTTECDVPEEIVKESSGGHEPNAPVRSAATGRVAGIPPRGGAGKDAPLHDELLQRVAVGGAGAEVDRVAERVDRLEPVELAEVGHEGRE